MQRQKRQNNHTTAVCFKLSNWKQTPKPAPKTGILIPDVCIMEKELKKITH